MGGNRVDQLGAGCRWHCLRFDALLEEMPRLKVLRSSPAWRSRPAASDCLDPGFGAVGRTPHAFCASACPGSGDWISDAQGYLYDHRGLPIEQSSTLAEHRQVTRNFFNEVMISDRWGVSHAKLAPRPTTCCANRLCLIPASPVSNYLDSMKALGQL